MVCYVCRIRMAAYTVCLHCIKNSATHQGETMVTLDGNHVYGPITEHFTDARQYPTYREALAVAQMTGIAATPQQALSPGRDYWVVVLPSDQGPCYVS